MRVLWVEDFGGSTEAESLLHVVFSNLLSVPRLESLVDTQRRGNAKSRPHGYEKWRAWYSDQPVLDNPEIDIYRKAIDFDNLVSSGFLVDRYDAVLLDINLENDFYVGELTYPASEGGFWLYNKLVRAGFPSERIALLTAHNTEQPTAEFVAGCERYGHESLRLFGKTSADAGQWIEKLTNENDGFLNLRRGVLDGAFFVEEALRNYGDEAIRFNCFVKIHEALSYDQALDYLDTTRHLLPVRVTAAQLASQLRGFRYLLACEWDRVDLNSIDDDVYQPVGRVMKYLRNWSSHGHLLDSASVGDIAFLAMIGFRACFSVPDGNDLELRRYEHRLLIAVNAKVDSVDLSKRLAISYGKAKRLLWTVVGQPSNLSKDGSPVVLEDRRAFYAIVNQLAIAVAPPAGFGFPKALRELLVHSVISPKGPKVDGGNPDNLNAVELDFEHGLSSRWEKMPNWLKATSVGI